MDLHSKKWISRRELSNQLRELGLAQGDLIMVHASLRAVGEILGGPDELIGALLDAVGGTGTLMMYVGCQMPFDDLGRGIFTKEQEKFIFENCPAFDPLTARASRDFGALAEFFRTTSGVKVSGNPGARMAAIGADAEFLTVDHPLNYGLGDNSPLHRLCEKNGKVLLLGSDLDAVTLLHYAEARAPIAGKKLVNIRVPLLVEEKTVWTNIEEFNSSTGICDWEDQYFEQILKQYIASSRILSAGKVGNAQSYLISASDLVEFAIPVMVADAAKLSHNK